MINIVLLFAIAGFTAAQFPSISLSPSEDHTGHSISQHRRHHHHRHHHRRHPKCHYRKCCEVTTVKTCYDEDPAWLYDHQCPTNAISYIDHTVAVEPVSSVAVNIALMSLEMSMPSAASTATVCTPCTAYLSQMASPVSVCTTMVLCDVAEQNNNCRQQDASQIESILSMASRSGGQVYVNGDLIIFSSESTRVSNTSEVVAAGQNANDATSEMLNPVLLGALLAIVGLLYMF